MADENETLDAAVAWVERLHAVVDELAAPIENSHEGLLACRPGCAGCCVDDLTVFDVEAELVRRRHPELLAHGAPHAEGACAFLDAEGRCRIYDVRPYVCRTQGLPLRWIEEDENGEIFEQRDVCPLNMESVAFEELPADALWTIGPFEQRLAEKQAEVSGGVEKAVEARTPLRDLFAATNRGPRRLPIVR